jgi:hypothetical protein
MLHPEYLINRVLARRLKKFGNLMKLGTVQLACDIQNGGLGISCFLTDVLVA